MTTQESSRTHVCVSYSHRDREWRDRFEMHLSVLQRKELVEVWSDMNVGVGQRWEQEIEASLTKANVAVLLVSPAFLASHYIWAEEMPRILNHAKAGLRILPLIARPCAWRLAGELACLQARPAGGRPLSTGSEPQIDVDLTEFVHELARMVGAVPKGMVTDRWEASMAPAVEPVTGRTPAEKALDPLHRVWAGSYPATSATLTLYIDAYNGDNFVGRMAYDSGDVVTEVRGAIQRNALRLAADPMWRGIGSPSDVAVIFRETRIMRAGQRERVPE